MNCSATRCARSRLVGTGRGAHVDHLAHVVLELLEGERPVVQRRWQPEAEVDQDLLAGPVVLVHAVHLRDRDVALVHDQQVVGREVVDQGPRPRPSLAPGQVARVVLDPRAEADLAHHLGVELRALLQPRGLQLATLGAELRDPLLHLRLDLLDRLHQLVARRHVVGGRVDVHVGPLGQHLSGQVVDLHDPLDLVAEEVDPHDVVAGHRRELQHVAAHPELGTGQLRIVALVLQVDQVAQHAVAPVLAADLEVEHGGAVVDRCTDAVDARHRGHDDHVAPLEQRPRGVVAQPVDLVVPGRVLLDVRIGAREVGLRLEVVVVADEVLDRVVREELLELLVELRRQRLVVGHHQGRLLHRLDQLGGGEGLARAGGPQQHLVPEAGVHASGELGDRLRLISGGLVGSVDLQFGHGDDTLVRAALRGYPDLTETSIGTDPADPSGL